MFTEHAIILICAILLDASFARLEILWQYLPHPVEKIKKLIDALEKRYNRKVFSENEKLSNGIRVILMLILAATISGILLNYLIKILPGAFFVEALIVSLFLSQRRAYENAHQTMVSLSRGDLETARLDAQKILDRDTDNLSRSALARAIIEACIKRLANGLIAPVFWYFLTGLPGLIIYTVINITDRKIGYFDPRFRNFGFWTAKLNDVVNFIPSRISAAVIIMTAKAAQMNFRQSLVAVRQDARLHRSPNFGWPEAAAGGALELALAGPRSYGGIMMYDNWMNEKGRKAARPEDISRALGLCINVNAILLLCLMTLTAATRLL